MTRKSGLRESTAFVMTTLLLLSIILILCSKYCLAGLAATLAESLGVAIGAVVTAAFLYERFLAEKHFGQFREEMSVLFSQYRTEISTLLTRLDNVQSSCSRMGILELFQSRTDYQQKHPMDKLFGQVRPGGRILVIGRTMFHFFNQADAINAALRRGAAVQVACLGSPSFDPILGKICVLRASEMRVPLEYLRDLLDWMRSERPSGRFELRTFSQPIPDSLVYIEMEQGELVVWDLTFGRDLSEKRVFLLDACDKSLGRQLLTRYERIWDDSEIQITVDGGGTVSSDRLAELIARFP